MLSSHFHLYIIKAGLSYNSICPEGSCRTGDPVDGLNPWRSKVCLRAGGHVS
jgi:hypothetical protein